MIFFIALALLLVVSYFVIAYFMQVFFYSKIQKTNFSGIHVTLIVCLFFLFIVLSLGFFDGEISNRVQHALGGGAIMVIVCYLSYRASQISLTKFQFFVVSILIATAFGVANELVESILQLRFDSVFALNIADTWMDLWANTIGALAASILLVAFVDKD